MYLCIIIKFDNICYFSNTGSLPMKVLWVHNDQEIPDSRDFRYCEESSGNYSLVIRNADPHDAGLYFCEAYNAYGQDHSYCKMVVHGE